jgi:hypothetical protein
MFFWPGSARLQDHGSRRAEGRKSDVTRNDADFAERDSRLKTGSALGGARVNRGAMVNRSAYYSATFSGGSDERDGLLGSTSDLGCPGGI